MEKHLPTTLSRRRIWAGRIIAGFTTLFLLMDGVMKLIQPRVVVETTVGLGYPASSITGIGTALLLCTILYLIPRTAVLGAILLTGYLGGAVATHVRVQAPLFNILFPVLLAVALWAALVLQNPRLQALLWNQE
ncbi:MAG: DoxX family protein [Bryobacteraceae bacterium]